MRAMFTIIFLLFTASVFGQQINTTISSTSNLNPAFLLTTEDIEAYAAQLNPSESYANVTVLERDDPATPTGLAYRLAVDRRTPPQRAAQHASEAEIWAIVEGNGAITTDGRIVDIIENGETVGRRIEEGTVHTVSKGDFLVIPEGVPHQVTEFDPSLLIVTFEFPR